jgi:hypothetical protein
MLKPLAFAAALLLTTPADAAQPQLRLEPFQFELADGSTLPAERGRMMGYSRMSIRSRARSMVP